MSKANLEAALAGHELLRRTLPAPVRADGGSATPLLLWVHQHCPILSPGVRFDLVDHPWLRDIYACTATEMVLMKSSQLGASEFAIRYALHAADQRLANVLYVFPTETHLSDFSAARVGPAIESSRYLSQIVGSSVEDGARRTNRVMLRRVRDRHLYFRGAQVTPDGRAPQLKSVPADVIVLDEIDEMDPRAIAIAEKRLNHSNLRTKLMLSTPTYAGRGVHAAYLESNRSRWFVPCPSCGTKQAITLDHVVTEYDDLTRPVAWNHYDGDVYAACEKCGKPLDRLARGEWVAEDPTNPRVGWHLTGFYSKWVNLRDVVKRLRSTSETVVKECLNQDLGLAHIPRGGQITQQDIERCAANYPLGPAADGSPAFAGIDVGPEYLHVVIRGAVNSDGQRPLRWVGVVSSFDEARGLLTRHRVRRAVVDMLPETRAARAFQKSFAPGRIWLAEYSETERQPDALEYRDKEMIVRMHRTRTMDAVVSMFRLGEALIPNAALQVEGYVEQLCAPTRVIVETGRSPVARYVHFAPDHFFHAENYCLAASEQPRANSIGIAVARRAKGW